MLDENLQFRQIPVLVHLLELVDLVQSVLFHLSVLFVDLYFQIVLPKYLDASKMYFFRWIHGPSTVP